MIGILDVEVQAANPLMPLYPLRAYVNSPSSVRVRNVPKKIGNWDITEVQVAVAYPDNSIKSANCVRVGCVWVGTVGGSSITGTSENGFTIYANGTDENGNAVTGYVLGKGLVEILDNDGTITPGQDTHYLHLLDAQPTNPKEGDVWKNASGEYVVWQNNRANPLGISSQWVIQQLSSYERKSDLQNDVDTIVTRQTLTDWNYPEKIGDYWYAPDIDWVLQYGDTSKQYYSIELDYSSSTQRWNVNEWEYEYFEVEEGEFQWIETSVLETNIQSPEDTLSLTIPLAEPFGGGTIVITRESINSLGLAMLTDLATKQDILSQPQMNAINSVVDERTTVITFDDNTTSYYNWVGEINRQTMIDAGLFDGDNRAWIKLPVTVKIGTEVTSIGNDAFEECDWLTSVTIPNSVTSIGEYAFADCIGLTSITIPDGVTSIGVSAFYGCSGLTSVTIGNNVMSIGDCAFWDCTGLTSVTIPNSVTSIGDGAFQNCSGLTSVTILDNGLHNLKTIGDYAFQGCSNLLNITLPQGVTSIGVDAFAETYAYFKLYLTEAVPTLVPSAANYPWGVANTANILTIRNASKEWVEEQAYGKGFVWRNATINARLHTCSLYAFNINALTLNSAVASFKVTMNATAYTTARDLYFAVTLGNFTQPMTWDTPFDKFEGGSAAAIAPKPNTMNIYHIFEYASGHFMVSKFSSALDELGDIETLINAI